ncbi:MAG: coenzyme F420-0:L-glutamate ligase [Candidatus Eremiobacterota bacterium]
MDEIGLIPLKGLPEVRPGDDLAGLLAACAGPLAQPGDVLVVTHKVVSKAEGRMRALEEVSPSPLAERYADAWGKDPRQLELVLQESASVLRMERGIVVSRTPHGLVCANAGVDRSNVPGEAVCLLPLDPDGSARRIGQRLESALGYRVPVLISDSFGRPWRVGIVNVAIGVWGMRPVADYRGQLDPHGYRLEASLMATADAMAAAAELAMGKTLQVPAVLVRGARYQAGDGSAAELVRPPQEDLFR